MAEILFLEDEVTIREVIAEYMNVAGHKEMRLWRDLKKRVLIWLSLISRL